MYEIVRRGESPKQTHEIQSLVDESFEAREPFKIVYTKPGRGKTKVIHVHYKRGCPYTLKMLELMKSLPYSVEYHMIPNDLPGVRAILGRYLKQQFFTFPQIFVKGESIGGATEAAEKLPRLTD